MNDIPNRQKFASRDRAVAPDAWTKLMALAAMMEMDHETGALTVRNGKSSLTLRADGRITVQGVSIVQTAERNIALDAATIDLN